MNLIDLSSYPVNVVLDSLLKDKSTKKNIIFATNAYTESDATIDERTSITSKLLKGFDACVIQPRVSKSLEQQAERTRKKAEVFTPSWICNKMNNHCDEEWFGRPNVFNTEDGQSWILTEEPIAFDNPKDWQKYVDSKRLEITCGEAPYIVSRYDASTGELIDIKKRIGILDRKLRVVNENTETEADWLKWVIRAYQSVYGYEFQGDNLLIARINLLVTFVDYMQDRWNRIPTDAELKKITNIIVWNLWQMDGITGTVPFGKPVEEYQQMSFFDFVEGNEEDDTEAVDCRIEEITEMEVGRCPKIINTRKREVIHLIMCFLLFFLATNVSFLFLFGNKCFLLLLPCFQLVSKNLKVGNTLKPLILQGLIAFVSNVSNFFIK